MKDFLKKIIDQKTEILSSKNIQDLNELEVRFAKKKMRGLYFLNPRLNDIIPVIDSTTRHFGREESILLILDLFELAYYRGEVLDVELEFFFEKYFSDSVLRTLSCGKKILKHAQDMLTELNFK